MLSRNKTGGTELRNGGASSYVLSVRKLSFTSVYVVLSLVQISLTLLKATQIISFKC